MTTLNKPKTKSNEREMATDLATDYETWQAIKPYIGHCLTLNHEINNALTALLGYLEIISIDRDGLSPSQIEYLETMRQATQRIQSAAQQLSREKIELAERIDLKPIVDAYTRLSANQSK